MTSPFSNAANSLLGALDSAAGESITYSRGPLESSGTDTVSLTAATGRTPFDAVDGDGFATTFRSKDWIFPAADLSFDDGATIVEPAEGDEIRWTDENEIVHVFRVVPMGGGRELFRYCGGAQQRVRVHTKRMGTE